MWYKAIYVKPVHTTENCGNMKKELHINNFKSKLEEETMGN